MGCVVMTRLARHAFERPTAICGAQTRPKLERTCSVCGIHVTTIHSRPYAIGIQTSTNTHCAGTMLRMNTMIRVTLALLICATGLLSAVGSEAQQIRAFVMHKRILRTVNVGDWFMGAAEWGGETPDQLKKRLESHMTATDYAWLRERGITGIRLLLSAKLFYNPKAPESLKGEKAPFDPLPYLDAALRTVTKNKLLVILDLHDIDQQRMENEVGYADGYVPFWRTLAKRYANISPDLLIFEPRNEPSYDKREGEWHALQATLVAAIRSVAPKHTIMVTGAGWGGRDGLLRLPKLSDDNLIYSFHYYAPFAFTHQGATWINDEGIMNLRSVPYPPSQSTCKQITFAKASKEATQSAIDYCRSGHDGSFIKYEFQEIAAWAAKDKAVPLFLGEFGAFGEFAPKADHARYIKDVRSAAEANGIAWSAFCYDCIFALDRKIDASGRISLRDDVAEALGLKKRK
jgi:endoglucanase